MSNETNSPVKMVTAAYLDPSYFSEEPAATATPKTQNSSQTNGLEKSVQVVSCVMIITLIITFLLVAPANAMKNGSAKKDRRWSGVDSMLRAVGVKKTRKEKLLEKIEKNRKASLTPSAQKATKTGADAKSDEEEWDQQLQSNSDEDSENLNDE